MRVLVTGVNGLVGSRLARLLLSKGHEVSATGRGAQRVAAATSYHPVDLADAAGLKQLVEAVKPNVVVNCGGMTDVDGCEKDRPGAWSANVEGPASLAQASNTAGAHLIHVSTDYVFDGSSGPYDVNAIPNPAGVYSTTKLAGEIAVRMLAKAATIARTAVVYGWPAAGRANFGSWLVSSLKAGKTLKLFDDQWVTPSLALNVAEMLCALAEKANGSSSLGIVHVAGAQSVDRVSFGRALAKRFGFDESLIEPTHMADAPLAIARPAKSGLITTSAAQLLPVKPLGLDASLDQFFAETQEEQP